MTIQETTQILFMLSAYYGQGKSNAKLMAVAWNAILQDYDFGITQEAVVEFAKNDKREYASFPTPGNIVNAIEDRVAVRQGVLNAKLQDKPYGELADRYTQVITKENYEKITKEQIENRRDEMLTMLFPKPRTSLLITD